MTQDEVKRNGTYKVCYDPSNGFGIISRDIRNLFPTRREDDSRISVLLYMNHHDLDEHDNSGRELAYALSTLSYIDVGITTHPDADHAHEANAVLTRLTLPEDHKFHGALNEYDDGKRAMFTASDQRERFTGKSIGEVVRAIHDEVQALS